MKKNFLSATALILAVSTLSGCRAFTSEKVENFPLVGFLSEQEAIDYYAKSLDYDAVVSKNVDVHKVVYETRDVDNDTAEELKKLVAEVEAVLSEDTYTLKEDILNPGVLITDDMYNYVKATIDGYKLSNGAITSIKGALGYYFVDVEYDVAPQEAGVFKENSDMVAINNVWLPDKENIYVVNREFLASACIKINEYFLNNDVQYCAEYSSETGLITLREGDPEEVMKYLAEVEMKGVFDTSDDNDNKDNKEEDTTSKSEDTTSKTEDTTSKDDATSKNNTTSDTSNTSGTSETSGTSDTSSNGDTSNTSDTSEDTESKPEVEIPDIGDDKGDTIINNSVTPDERKVHLDVAFINKIVGSGSAKSSYLPQLELVYDKPTSGGLAGFGIYPEGSNGLRIFGYDRNSLSGKMTLRYVMKDSVDGTGSITVEQIYAYKQDLSTGFNVSAQNVILPEFLQSELEQLIEKSDRALVNTDLPGLMSGSIYEDKGYAILRGYKDIGTSELKHMSKIRQVLQRDTKNNAYLLDVETTLIDGPKSSDGYGTFKDRSFIVVQQLGDKFVITDSVKISRETMVEPEINPDSATAKRLVALNLSGVVSDTAKDEIKKLISELYTAGTNRVMAVTEPKEIGDGENKFTITKGISDCFNHEPTMLSTENRDYMCSALKNVLTKHGSVQGVYSGVVTEWIGGYKNQAEFTTEELVSYTGLNEGHYMQVYYLVSKMNDVWVIDERTVFEEYDLKGAELDTVKQRVGQ